MVWLNDPAHGNPHGIIHDSEGRYSCLGRFVDSALSNPGVGHTLLVGYSTYNK